MAKKKATEEQENETSQEVTAESAGVDDKPVSEVKPKPRASKKAVKAEPKTEQQLDEEAFAAYQNPYAPQFENPIDRERFRRLRLKWRSDFLMLSPERRQHALFGLMHDRLFWRIVCYMRRFPETLTSGRQTYSDRCVGVEELRSYMGQRDEAGFAQTWLEDNRIPPMEDAVNALVMFNSQIAELLSMGGDYPIVRIKRNFALSDLELEILATLVISMREETLLRMMVVAWADFSVRIPTVTFLSNLLSSDPGGAAVIKAHFSEEGTLRRFRLVIAEKHALFPNYTPRAYAPISIDQTVIDAFSGESRMHKLPANLMLHTKTISMRTLIAEPSTVEELEYALKSTTARICLDGPAHSGRRTMLCAITQHEKKKSVLEVDISRFLERVATDDIESKFSGLMREALLEGSVLMIRCDSLEEHAEVLQRLGEHVTQLSRMVEAYPGEIAVLAVRHIPILDDIFGHLAIIHIQPPSVDQANIVWQKALEVWTSPEDCAKMAEVFSRNYSLPIGSIFAVVRDAVEAQQSVSPDSTIQSHHILNEIRKSFRHQLGSLAEITVSDVPLAGVVLPAEAKAQVNEILEYAKNLHNVLDTWGFRQRSPYGNALSVLFAGPPGTGKTLLACALANELGKVLYRVDLSRIVDKYIGETEKNLGKIFDEAAKAQAIILFDEADSLFAKRTEVKSSNDRYANLEINFLLQKLESYNGITILTTNLSKSIDEAFRRRLRFIIDFPMPDVPSRIALWKRMMPPNAPLSDDIRWSWLARTFEMSGGYIRNAVLKAAISASAAHKPISMEYLAKAAGDQARSMGKLMRIDDDYDDYYEDDRSSGSSDHREYSDDDDRF